MGITDLVERARRERSIAGQIAEGIVWDLIAGALVLPERFDRYALQRATAEQAEAELLEATL